MVVVVKNRRKPEHRATLIRSTLLLGLRTFDNFDLDAWDARFVVMPLRKIERYNKVWYQLNKKRRLKN